MDNEYMPDMEGIILAGGKSRRFGSAKCLYHLHDEPLISYGIRTFQDLGISVTVITSADQVENLSDFAAVLADESRGRGPVQALMQAARHVSGTHFIVLPCDTPFVSGETLLKLAHGAKEDNLDAFLARDSTGRVHPLVGCYSASIDSAAEDVLSAGSASVWRMVDLLPNVKYLPVADSELFNINTLEDVEAAEGEIKRSIA
ncbi:MAG: molybdenum cofactor guanylyltransferase [Rhodothermales bacterium]|nr:molybdenum cofactor guanylyltransferase [Rhodothermales bacterium]